VSALATDNFNRADGGLGANWTTATSSGAPQISTNVVITNAVATDSRAYYSAISWPDDQYSQIVVVAITSNLGAIEAATRVASGSLSMYMARAVGPTGPSAVLAIDKYVTGTFTNLTNATKTIAVSDVIRIESIGSSHNAYINGTVQQGPISDSANTSGNAGIVVFVDSGTTADAKLDTWEAGDFSGALPISFDKGSEVCMEMWDWAGLY